MRSCCPGHAHKMRGCIQCRAYNMAYRAARREAMRAGTWEPDWTGTDLERVRLHVRSLLAVPSITGPLLAKITGISDSTIYDARRGRRKSISAVNAKTLLTVTPEQCFARQTALANVRVDSTGLARRLQALAAEGWDTRTLEGLTGDAATHIRGWRAQTRPRVQRTTHEVYRALYDKIQGMPDPSGPSQRAIQTAQSLGYLPPERWADEDIDNPLAEPLPPEPDTDDQVLVSQQILRALESPTPSKAADYPRAVQREIAKRARHDDWPWERIAELLGFRSASSVEYLVGGRPDRRPVKRERAK